MTTPATTKPASRIEDAMLARFVRGGQQPVPPVSGIRLTEAKRALVTAV
jgi:hypothetical protein